jgi:hypothetical protein
LGALRHISRLATNPKQKRRLPPGQLRRLPYFAVQVMGAASRIIVAVTDCGRTGGIRCSKGQSKMGAG